MKSILIGHAATAAILAICMGAGPTDFRGGAIVLAIIAGACVAIRDALKDAA